jgi:hypothetical protein
MSNHEFQNIKKTGVIQSKGEYNLAGQQGLTYFSTEPRSAETYAHSFAPWNQKANWDNPAWVIAVPKPDESKIVHVQGTGSHEVGVKGSIPANQTILVCTTKLHHQHGCIGRKCLLIHC